MWSPLLLCLLVGIASANQYAFRKGQEYTYDLRGRTVAAFHQVKDQYTGIALKAQLKCQPKGSDALSCYIQSPEVAEIHAQLPGGWDSPLNEKKTNYQGFELSSKPFEIKYKNGAIDDLVVEKSLPTWQVNIIKSIASQLQVDTQGENAMKSRFNQEPEDDKAYATYKAMEDTVTGQCEVLYDISPLPEYVLQTKPELAPIPSLKGDGQIIDIVKTNNFSNCDQRMGYHFGISGATNWEAGSNTMGDFLSKSSVSRIVISGSLEHYTIHSSVTTNKIAVSPTLQNEQKGMVVSRLNITLQSVNPASGSPKSPSNPESAGNLVYSYNSPFEANNNRRPAHNDESNDSSSSSSSSSSSEEYQGNNRHQEQEHQNQQNRYQHGHRQSRSVNQKNNDQSSSSSSESGSSSSSESDSLSSSEEYWQATPTLENAPQNPMLPYFIGYKGSAIQQSSQVDVVAFVKKLANQIGAELQKPSNIPAKDTLEKFADLAALLRTMSLKQIDQAAHEMYEPAPQSSGKQESQSQSVKRSAWKAYRDAVAQAGTGPAFSAIKNWITTKKVKGAEAAELIAVLPSTCRHPTQEYMDAFFELATSPEVTRQDQLNATIILAFADLARESQVNNASAHNRYPVHSFGRLYPKNSQAVANKWIPYVAKQLKNAIRDEDSPKIQVYIRALGNFGHTKMLEVLEPYLEGEQDCTTFQRLTMVLTMDKLAKLYPNYARPVFYRIYQNTGEAYQVRTAAVFQLMRTNPPASMLQRMAEFTNQDTSNQVNAAVKAAIESACDLEGDEELAHNARAAAPLLTTDNMGLQYSKSWLRDYSVENMNAAYQLTTNWIGSDDAIVPQAVFATLKRNKGGFEIPQSNYAAMVSSVDDLLDVLYDQFQDDDDQATENQENSSKFSPENILKALNIQSDDQEQLEGSILFSSLQWNRFIAFDNNTIDQLPALVKKAVANLKHGQKFNYTKLYSEDELTVSFPTAMGLPFVYSMQTPSLVQYGGEVRANPVPERYEGSNDEISIPDVVRMTTHIHAVYSKKMIARIGFVNPASHQHHVAGLDKNFQINLPLSAQVDVDIKNSHVRAVLQPINQDQSYNLVHYSNWPYTVQRDLLSDKPASQQKGYQAINVRETQQNEWTFGQKSTGFALRLTSENQNDPRQSAWAWAAQMLQSHDAYSPFAFFGNEETIEQSNYNLYWDAEHCANEAVILTASYSTYTKGMNGDEYPAQSAAGQNWKHPAARKSGRNDNEDYEDDDQEQSSDHAHFSAPQPNNQEPDSESRQTQFLKLGAAGIKDGYSRLVDLGARFQGKKEAQYVATIAMTRSAADKKTRVLFYYNAKPAQEKNFQICLSAQSSGPKVPIMDFFKALSTHPTNKVQADIKFGESCESGAKVQIEGKLEQSQEQREYLEESPMAKQCAQQMKEDGNNVLPACRNVTQRANYFDEGSITVRYQQVPNYIKNISAQAYGFVRYLSYHNYYENTVNPEHQRDGQIDFEYEISPDFEHLNVSMNAPTFDANITNLEIDEWARPLVAVDPVQSAAQRLGREVLAGQYYPTCAIDSTQVSTFDNKTYPIKLGNCWHVVMTAIPDDDDDDDDDDESYARSKSSQSSNSNSQNDDDIPDDMEVSVVGRDVNDKQREYRLVLGDTEIQMFPGKKNPTIKVDSQQVTLSESRIYRHAQNNEVDFEAYILPGGVVVVDSSAYGIKAAYDGYRIKLILNNNYRDQIRGLCGTFTGEPATDFTSPNNCILREPELFAASYALTNQDQCSGPALQNSRKVEQAHCYRETILHGNVVSDQDAGRQDKQNYNSKWGSNKTGRSNSNSKSKSESCTNYRTIVQEEDDQICFSLRPVPTCSQGCKATQKQEKNVQMHCIQRSSHAEAMAQRIKNGANPDYSQKASNKNTKMSVPERCVAN